MSTLLVRNLDADLVEALKARGASNHRSMEAEVRAILAAAVSPNSGGYGIGSRIRDRFVGLNWEDARRSIDAPRAADFDA